VLYTIEISLDTSKSDIEPHKEIPRILNDLVSEILVNQQLVDKNILNSNNEIVGTVEVFGDDAFSSNGSPSYPTYKEKWVCENCRFETMVSYEELVEIGEPICPDCDENLILVEGSGVLE